ncbi:hypothetical protein PFICI_08994 [Pestalotiopsis fici W106-1]|uniref:Gag1-like clamp domain-containing protein n=1 Tax=Pestalotiopsis fici (strain W106-1 / CGMCC3.15140) TaxID=1229662 RepID=W3X1U8_PESFW|nr:uncharacterized protein PFICI_08994 [Pestalotiopsis fici W106-1]ETS79141.1 hypothetical protein PFICI_08994 [Pestalotiopsis fici W106-1]
MSSEQQPFYRNLGLVAADPSMAPRSQKTGPAAAAAATATAATVTAAGAAIAFTNIEPSTATGRGGHVATATMTGSSTPQVGINADTTPRVIAPHSAPLAAAEAVAAAAAGQIISSSPPLATSTTTTTAAASASSSSATTATPLSTLEHPSSSTCGLAAGAESSLSGRSPAAVQPSSNMLFSDLYKSTRSPLSRLRQQSSANSEADFDADLVSKDKAKNKEAVKRYLAEKIRNDWEFKWPRPAPGAGPGTGTGTGVANPAATSDHAKDGPVEASTEAPSHDHEDNAAETVDANDDDGADDSDDAESVYSTVSEDTAHFKPRLEWWSDWSDDDTVAISSAYRFDTPDAVGSTVKATAEAKRAKRRRAVREEATWNLGLACFNARRDAWTGAKTVRVKPKAPSTPTTPMSPSSRRLSFFRFVSSSPPASPGQPLSPEITRTSGDTTAVTSSDGDSKEHHPRAASSRCTVETLLPLAPPLLPPANPMRASITPATYSNLYDRIIVHSLTPACPVNLADVLRSCVVGWKRDGEWPPRQAEVPISVVAVKNKKKAAKPTHSRQSSTGRRLSLGFLGRRESTVGDAQPADPSAEDGGAAGKGIRKSIQRVLGLGHERSGSNASNNAVA